MHELGFVGRRHDHKARKDPEEANVERAGVGRAIGANEARPVDCEAYRQFLNGHVMDDLIVAALQEGRINRAKRPKTLGREAGGEGDGMLFRDAYVEGALRKDFLENIETRAARHRGGNRDDLVVLARLGDQGLGEDPRIGRRVRFRLYLNAGNDIEGVDAMVFVG